MTVLALILTTHASWAGSASSERQAPNEQLQPTDPDAEYALGNRYRFGKGVPKNVSVAIQWYRLAAAQGHAAAQFALGFMHDVGEGVAEDDAEAVRWYRGAAEKGHPRAQFILGIMYGMGQGVDENDTEALKWFRLAAEQGLAAAQLFVGVMYDRGEGAPENDAEALKWYRLAAEQGDATAQFNVALMYDNGKVLSEDDSEAVKWYSLAADQGHARAQLILGMMYDRGEGVPENDAEAFKWYRLAAAQGDATAQFKVALMYDNGKGVSEDDSEAVKWYRLAAGQGLAGAQFIVGVMYDRGEGVPENDAEAFKWYRLAAEQGDAAAQFEVGVMYDQGEGVSQDKSQAFEWFQRAAEQGVAPAQFSLAVFYDDVLKNYSDAMKWYKMAAEQGVASAQFNLGVMYASGKGVLTSGAAAADWYYKAGVTYLKEGEKEDALLCVERIRNLDAVLHLTVPNLFLADELLRMTYGPGNREAGNADGSPSTEQIAFGTGWTTSGGYVVTNFHVVDGHDQFTLLLENGEQLAAERFVADPANDLVLLKVAAPSLLPPGLPLAAQEPDSGTPVFTVGYPHPTLMGAEAKLTDGIINARSGLAGDVRWFQISAPVQAGNSGGPLFNMRGEVVGIVVAKLNAQKVFQLTGDLPENVNFAIKVAYLRPLLEGAPAIRPSLALNSGQDSLVSLSKRVRESVVLVLAR